MACKPPPGVTDDRLQRSRLGEEMARTRNDLQCLRTLQARESLLVELDDAMVEPAHDQEGRRANPVQHVAGKIRAPAARDDGADPIVKPCGGDESRRGAGACPE